MGGLALAATQQLIPHGTKHCLASTNVGPALLVCIPPDFIDLSGMLKPEVGAACGYALALRTVHDMIGTKHITSVGAEELKEDCLTLRSGGGL